MDRPDRAGGEGAFRLLSEHAGAEGSLVKEAISFTAPAGIGVSRTSTGH